MKTCKITKIAEDTFLFTDTSLGWYYNSTVILTDEAPIIIDVFSDGKIFNDVIEFITEKGFNKPAAIVYTHWHSDHTTGNRIFKDCRIISHEATVKHLVHLRDKLISINKADLIPLMPTETINRTKELIVGHKKLELIHCPGHTYDSILVYDRGNKILIAGDNLISNEVDFFLPPLLPEDKEDANYKDLKAMFKTVETIKADKIIPGHGLTLDPQELISLNRKRYNDCLSRM